LKIVDFLFDVVVCWGDDADDDDDDEGRNAEVTTT
jgi:hypothetical protein